MESVRLPFVDIASVDSILSMYLVFNGKFPVEGTSPSLTVLRVEGRRLTSNFRQSNVPARGSDVKHLSTKLLGAPSLHNLRMCRMDSD
jgi:hypothetical protein